MQRQSLMEMEMAMQMDGIEKTSEDDTYMNEIYVQPRIDIVLCDDCLIRTSNTNILDKDGDGYTDGWY